jgi:hypothetical protein
MPLGVIFKNSPIALLADAVGLPVPVARAAADAYHALPALTRTWNSFPSVLRRAQKNRWLLALTSPL